MVCSDRTGSCLHRLPESCGHDARSSALGRLLLPHDHHAGSRHAGRRSLSYYNVTSAECVSVSSHTKTFSSRLGSSSWAWRLSWLRWRTCIPTWSGADTAESCCCCWCALFASSLGWSWSRRWVLCDYGVTWPQWVYWNSLILRSHFL